MPDEWPQGAPGSDQARAAGCRCPVLDNGHGRGIGGDGKKRGWWINEDCVLHRPKPDAKFFEVGGIKVRSTDDLA